MIKQLYACMFVLSALNAAAQTDELPAPSGPDRSVKYPLERYGNQRVKTLRQGRSIYVEMNAEDTTLTYYGQLVNISREELVLSAYELGKSINEEYHMLDESIYFEEPECMTLPISTIRSLKYENWYNGYVNLFTGLSGVSAILVAPLASIDKHQPNYFNATRYRNIVVPSLLCLGTGLSLAIILEAGENRFKLKPKLRFDKL